MNQLTVLYQEIENRLAICCEYLLDRKKPIEEAYDSLMEKLGTKLMEYSEFEYWFKRFQDNQFDLGYDTSQDSMDSKANGAKNDAAVIIEKKAPVKVRKSVRFKIDEAEGTAKKENKIEAENDKGEAIPVVVIERNDDYETDNTAVIPHEIVPEVDKNTDYRFDIQNVPVIFQELIHEEIGNIGHVSLSLVDPEKSIIDHLWFVLKNPDIKLQSFNISVPADFEKLNLMFQSMFDLFDHQLCITALDFDGLNEDTFVSLLKHVEPKTLRSISFNISWKEEGNYVKMKEIVESVQWKLARNIYSNGISPLTVDDVLPFGHIFLGCDRITPEDVVRVRDHFLKSPNIRHCTLRNSHENLHYYEYENALQSNNLCARMIIKNSIAYL